MAKVGDRKIQVKTPGYNKISSHPNPLIYDPQINNVKMHDFDPMV